MLSGFRSFAKPAWFILVTYGLSLLLVAAYLAVGGTAEFPGRFALSVAYMFVPLTSAVLIQKVLYGQPFRMPLRLGYQPNRWWLLAWSLAPALAAATLAVSLLLPSVSLSTDMEGLFERYGAALTTEQVEEVRIDLANLPVHPAWLLLIQGMLAGATVNAIAAFGEEAGWRGLLLTELLPLGFWKCSFTIGLVWGVWHAPLILMGHNYPDHPVLGVGLMTVFCILLSPLLSLLVVRAQSVFAAAIFHGTLNAFAVLPLALVAGGNDLTVGMTGMAGLVVLAGLNLVILFRTRKTLAAPGAFSHTD